MLDSNLNMSPNLSPSPENLSSTNSETANSDAVDVIEEAPMAQPVAPDAVSLASDVFSESEFTEFFISMFPLAGTVAGMFYPPEWQSLTQAPNIPTCRPAAGALYRLAQKYPWLRFLIERDTEWMKDIALVASFGMTVAMGVRSEHLARLKPQPRAEDAHVA